MHYVLIYQLEPDYLQRREEFRDEHLALAWEAHENNELLLGGALQEPSDQAFLLFESHSSESAEEFARNDPYVKNGIVRSWEVRPWMTVVGKNATTPIR